MINIVSETENVSSGIKFSMIWWNECHAFRTQNVLKVRTNGHLQYLGVKFKMGALDILGP